VTVGPVLNVGDAAVVVATADHRRTFVAALRRSGVDVTGAVASGRYLSFEAAELIDSFMIEGAPDPARFADIGDGLIERAGAGGRRVSIYGEMVALLWDAGDVVSAALEDLWNDLAGTQDFMLLCAYPMRSFRNSASGAAVKARGKGVRVRRSRTRVSPTQSWEPCIPARVRKRPGTLDIRRSHGLVNLSVPTEVRL
jgi:DcmR-like sensory protein